MLTSKHDCLFKDLIVPFMILKFRKLTLISNVPPPSPASSGLSFVSTGLKEAIKLSKYFQKYSVKKNNLITDSVSG